MKRFIERHKDRIKGIIHGFDRVLFRGTLRSIVYQKGMDIFLSSQHVLYKDFGRFAEKVSHRIKEHAERIAQQRRRPFRYVASSKLAKEDMAREIMVKDRIKEGLICVLSCVEPCQSYSIRRDAAAKQLLLAPSERKCLHIYFYFVDREFGFMHIRLQTWLPLSIQVCINGREYLARQMEKAGIRYEQRDNCFTDIEDIGRAQEILDRLEDRDWVPCLDRWARWVNPWVDPKAGWKLRGYYWSIRQDEYATDVMFKDAARLAEVYPRWIRHAIEQFGCDDVLRFLGHRTNIRFNGEVQTNLQRRIEGMRIKHWVDENSIKMYDKQGSVLRIETTINNARRFKVRRMTTRKGRRQMGWLRLRKGVADTRRRTEIARAANSRYLAALAVVGDEIPSHKMLDPVSNRLNHKGRSFRPLHPISPSDAQVFEVLLRGEFFIQGIRNKDLRKFLTPDAEPQAQRRRKAAGQMTRRLALLKAHGLIHKVPRTHYYRITKKGHLVMNTAIKLRHAIVDSLAA